MDPARWLSALLFSAAATTTPLGEVHAERVLLHCVFEYVEIQEAQFPKRNVSMFVEFDETGDTLVDRETLDTVFLVARFEKVGSVVTDNEIFLSYKGPAYYLDQEHQSHYFNWFRVTINRADDRFNAIAGPYYRVRRGWQEYFMASGNIEDRRPNAPSFLLYESLGWGTCGQYQRRF